MKWLAVALLVVVVLLQHRLWISDDGIRELLRLGAEVEAQRAANGTLEQRNRQLAAEVADLKQGFAALEERARSELGMVAGDETFYQVAPAQRVGRAADPATRTAAAR